MAEKPNERAARHIVSEVLGVPVTRFDDGSAPSQVDALVHYPDGTGALEVVGDHESAFNEQWAALEKVRHRVDVPGLRSVWSAQLERRAQVRRVAQELPALVLRWQDDLSRRHARSELPQELTNLGVIMLYPLEDNQRSGYVNLHAEGWGGFAGSKKMSSYVERVLAQHDDVPRKLAAHPTPEKHAFIWTTIGTDYSIQFQLEDREQSLPTEPPKLPNGVTHVWVGGSFNSQGVLAWFPDRGWWRTPWSWPTDQALVLDD